MRLNILKLSHLGFGGAPLRTHEGAPAVVISAEAQLRRAVLACMLWEDQFYEDGATIAERIAVLVPQVEAAKVGALAVEAREKMKLRHAPLLLVREMARYATHRGLVAETLARVIQRADELSEFLAIYWKDAVSLCPRRSRRDWPLRLPALTPMRLPSTTARVPSSCVMCSFSRTPSH